MTQTSGLGAICDAMQVIDPADREHQLVVEAIGQDVRQFVLRRADQMHDLVCQFDELASGPNGVVMVMIAARLFIEVQKYRCRCEQWVNEFDEACGEVGRDFAQAFVLTGSEN